MKTIRVLIVDDSALARRAIAASLVPFREIEVVGMAAEPYAARDQILALNPDVVTLDIEMPRMDGLSFLKIIMKHRPMPVIIMSSLTQAGSLKALEALQSGAVDIMEKPTSYSASPDGARLAQKIYAAAGARLSAGPAEAETRPPAKGAGHLAARTARTFIPRKIILLGASTGGTEAIKSILTNLRADLPGICIVQHIPAFFSRAFAERLNEICQLEVREAAAGDILTPGLALVAPGGYHMLLRWEGSRYRIELNEGPALHYQRPAVDILFDSAVRAGAGSHAVAALLTGMGADGAAGLLRLRDAGAVTIAQNEESCVVFGMPREAVRLGAAQKVLPLHQIGAYLDQAVCNPIAGPRATQVSASSSVSGRSGHCPTPLNH